MDETTYRTAIMTDQFPSLTENLVKRLQELAAKATPGPWIDIHSADSTLATPLSWQHRHELRQEDHSPSDKHHWPYRICQTIEGQQSQQADFDFAFIAACREGVPALIDAIEILTKERDEARRHRAGLDNAAAGLVNLLAEADDRARAAEAQVSSLTAENERLQGELLDMVEKCSGCMTPDEKDESIAELSEQLAEARKALEAARAVVACWGVGTRGEKLIEHMNRYVGDLREVLAALPPETTGEKR